MFTVVYWRPWILVLRPESFHGASMLTSTTTTFSSSCFLCSPTKGLDRELIGWFFMIFTDFSDFLGRFFAALFRASTVLRRHVSDFLGRLRVSRTTTNSRFKNTRLPQHTTQFPGNFQVFPDNFLMISWYFLASNKNVASDSGSSCCRSSRSRGGSRSCGCGTPREDPLGSGRIP